MALEIVVRNMFGLHAAPVSESSFAVLTRFTALRPASCGAIAAFSPDVMMPLRNLAFSCVTARLTRRVTVAGVPSVCSTTTLTWWPSTPPLALTSSAASFQPFTAPEPNLASGPDDGGNTATTNGSLLADFAAVLALWLSSLPHAIAPTAKTPAASRAPTDLILMYNLSLLPEPAGRNP